MKKVVLASSFGGLFTAFLLSIVDLRWALILSAVVTYFGFRFKDQTLPALVRFCDSVDKHPTVSHLIKAYVLLTACIVGASAASPAVGFHLAGQVFLVIMGFPVILLIAVYVCGVLGILSCMIVSIFSEIWPFKNWKLARDTYDAVFGIIENQASDIVAMTMLFARAAKLAVFFLPLLAIAVVAAVVWVAIAIFSRERLLVSISGLLGGITAHAHAFMVNESVWVTYISGAIAGAGIGSIFYHLVCLPIQRRRLQAATP